MTKEVELYRRHRPHKLSEVVGQAAAIAQLEKLLASGLPHALLLSGPSGVGKTTIARILKSKLGCKSTDFCEINAAESRGIDTIREIEQSMGLAPMFGACRVWLLDEVHRLTGDSMSAMMKLLEDTPSHVYFMLATTDPQKLLKPILTRCTQIKLEPVNEKALRDLLGSILDAESVPDMDKDVVDTIIEVADGSARKAIVILQQVLGLPANDRVDAVRKQDTTRTAVSLAKLLMSKGTRWQDVAKTLKDIEDEPEQIRRQVLGYAAAVLTNGSNNGRAFYLLECFETPFYDSGKPGLVRACYEVFGRG